MIMLSLMVIILVTGALISFFRGGGTPRDAAYGARVLATDVVTLLIHLVVYGAGALACLQLIEVILL
jgi:predicted signal transduction protein with EAL and GGDEF domain